MMKVSRWNSGRLWAGVFFLLVIGCTGPSADDGASDVRAEKAASAAGQAEPAASERANSGKAVSDKNTARQEAVPEGPFLRVLGTAQDGGLPHASCSCERCDAARQDPARRRAVASLALVLPGTEGRRLFLIDASPDVRQQLDRLTDLRPRPADRVLRSPVDGVFLTHAHIGHYLGLAFFGFEAVHTQGLPVWGTARMRVFLENHGPWSQLVEFGNIAPRVIPDEGVDLGDVRVEALKVPHRDEFTDTVAYRLVGPSQRVLYVPDTDAWSTWDPPFLEVLSSVDIALLDGTFYSLDELPGRSISQVKHPLITTSMDLLQERVDRGELEVYFTHLNHSNPALDPESEASREILRRSYFVLDEGQTLSL